MFTLIVAAEETAVKAQSIEGGVALMSGLMNSLAEWFAVQRMNLALCLGAAALSVLVALLLWYVVSHFFGRLAKRISPVADRIVHKLGFPVALLVLLAGFSLSNNLVDFPGSMDKWLDKTYYALFIIVFVWGLFRVIGVCDDYFAAKRKADPDASMNQLVADLLRRSLKAVVWFFTFIFIAQNLFSLNVTALLTGAGVAGLAVAFAAQNTIANIFGALSIVTDKVFKVGDVVVVNGTRGTIEAVGFRSTKLRSLDGTLWNLPNRVVADAAVENISQRPNIKYAFTLGLVYDTTPEQMRQALQLLTEILGAHPGLDHKDMPPRFSFTDFNDSSLDISVILWFNTLDFFEFQRMRQEINLEILSRFNAAGLSFAYPSVTNYVVEQK